MGEERALRACSILADIGVRADVVVDPHLLLLMNLEREITAEESDWF